MKIALAFSQESFYGYPQGTPEFCKGREIVARQNFANWLEANSTENFPINENHIIPKPIADATNYLFEEYKKGNFPVVRYKNSFLFYRMPKMEYPHGNLFSFSERVSIIRIVSFNEKQGLWTIQATPLGYENIWRLEKDDNNYVSYKKIIQKER